MCEALRQGDEGALETLLDREWRHLVSYARTLTGDADQAEEVTQRAFVRLWRRREHLDASGSVRALLYHTVRNLCVDLARKKRTRRQARALLSNRRRPARTPYEDLRARELREAMEAAVEELSPRRREAFTLCRVHGLGHREAAEVMDLAPQTVANHVTAALKQIRAQLAPQLL